MAENRLLGGNAMKICAYTGYRPHKLPFGDDESHPDCERLKQRLFCETLRLTREGTCIFISGMARGVDIWAAEIVLQLREALPFREIQLWLAIPYDRQAVAWNAKEQARYKSILEQADRVEYISYNYYNGCLQKRNRWMVDQSTHLIAVYNGQPGGTKSTLEYARRKGLDITVIEP